MVTGVGGNGGRGGAIVKDIRIVNAMYDVDLQSTIDLVKLKRELTTTKAMTCKLYHGRPQMLLVYLPSWRRNIQIFHCGKIQVMGRLSPSDAHSMITSVLPLLPLPNTNPANISVMMEPAMTPAITVNLRNIVVFVHLTMRVKLNNFPYSIGCGGAFYEPELFPALQINKWLPVHVSVFHSGKCVITGLTDLQHQLNPLLTNLVNFLNAFNLLFSSNNDDDT